MITESNIFTNITFHYNFESCIGDNEGYRYILEVHEDIMANTDEDGDFLVGKALRHVFLLNNAINDGYDINEIFDTIPDLYNIMNCIYDYDNCDIKEDLEAALYGDEGLWNHNITVFTKLGILPKYRGHGIAKKVIKDNVNVFGSMGDLIVMLPFPLQFESEKLHTTEFDKQMRYEDMEQDQDKATERLRNYYKSLGYHTVKNYNPLMFLTPSIPNKKLDAIDISEPIYNLRK